jgi:hypothetical protein
MQYQVSQNQNQVNSSATSIGTGTGPAGMDVSVPPQWSTLLVASRPAAHNHLLYLHWYQLLYIRITLYTLYYLYSSIVVLYL